MGQLFTLNNMLFLLDGVKLTLLISFIAIFLSTIFGTILGVMRQQDNIILRGIATIYIEIVRNVPNLLWIFVVFIIFHIPSFPAGIVSFTIFTSAAVAEIVRGGLNAVDKGQIESAVAQGFTGFQVLRYVILPQALRKMLPALVSQCTTVIKDTSLLYSVVAIPELTGKASILMGRYYEIGQILMLYGILALVYFVLNFTMSQFSRYLSKNWNY